MSDEPFLLAAAVAGFLILCGGTMLAIFLNRRRRILENRRIRVEARRQRTEAQKAAVGQAPASSRAEHTHPNPDRTSVVEDTRELSRLMAAGTLEVATPTPERVIVVHKNTTRVLHRLSIIPGTMWAGYWHSGFDASGTGIAVRGSVVRGFIREGYAMPFSTPDTAPRSGGFELHDYLEQLDVGSIGSSLSRLSRDWARQLAAATQDLSRMTYPPRVTEETTIWLTVQGSSPANPEAKVESDAPPEKPPSRLERLMSDDDGDSV